MIECIVGAPGAGKSLYACIRMMRAIRAGKRVYSNLFPREPNTWTWGNWDTMKEAGEGLFVVDEAQMWFNSREFKDNTAELGYWQQSRKRGADLLWIAQHENRVDVAVRELTSFVWRPRMLGPILTAKGETLEGETAGFDVALWRSYLGLYYTDQVIGPRNADAAELARVVPARELSPILRVQAPSHMWVDSEFRPALVPFVAGIPASCYLYRDYEGRWLELDSQWQVLGVVASPEAAWVRAARQALRERNVGPLASLLDTPGPSVAGRGVPDHPRLVTRG